MKSFVIAILLLMAGSLVHAQEPYNPWTAGPYGQVPNQPVTPYQSSYQSPAYPEVNWKDYAPQQNYQNQISPDQAYRIQQGNACAQIWANATAQRQCYSRIK